jgi:hypothetical protein
MNADDGHLKNVSEIDKHDSAQHKAIKLLTDQHREINDLIYENRKLKAKIKHLQNDILAKHDNR